MVGNIAFTELYISI